MKTTKATFGVTSALALLLLLTLAFAIPTALAADGDLDPTFGSGGLVTTDFQNTYDTIFDIAIQPDGKIVAVGTTQISSVNNVFSIARYNPNGALDTTFGTNGRQTTELSPGGDLAAAVAIQPDGKIVAAGYCEQGTTRFTAMARYNSNGTLDTTFGSGGKVCGIWSNQQISGVAIQPDGKILASGRSPISSTFEFAVLRFNANGTADTSFGVQGRVTTAFFGGINSANAIAMQPDGKILVAGTAEFSGFDYDFALARYLPNGFLDPDFSGDGIVTTDFQDGYDFAKAITLASNGKIYLAGSFYSNTQSFNFGLVRYNPNGLLDTTFSGDGLADLPVVAGAYSDNALDVLVQPADGKVVVVGGVTLGPDMNAALVRVNTNGSLDPTFGTGGILTHDYTGGGSFALSLVIQPDGKLISGGETSTSANDSYDFALARYLFTPPPAPTATSTRTSTPTPLPTATPVVCPIEYTDVPQGSTYYDSIHCLSCMGIVSGYTTGCPTGNPCFKPDNNLIRGDLAKIVSNAAGFTETYSTNTFQDVVVASPYFQFVERVASRSTMSGFSCGGVGEPCVAPRNRPYFRPNSSATRSEFAKAVATALNLPAPLPIQRSFEDVPTNHPYWRWIEALHRNRFIGGFACGGAGEPCVAPNNRPYFRPNSGISRGDASMTITIAYFPACVQGIPPRK